MRGRDDRTERIEDERTDEQQGPEQGDEKVQ